jgi:lysophospholipase L1-like esterase
MRIPLVIALTLATCSITWAEDATLPRNVLHNSGHLQNSRVRFDTEKVGHVAFIGGSITEMKGYRPMVCADLQKRFPDTKFTFTPAGVSSTCSTTGAFRLKNDVLSQGPVDLFFVEYAVNDDQDAGHAKQECIRGLEGIIRQTRQHNPHADIIVTFFVNPGMLSQLQAGKTPTSMEAHLEACKHYNVPVIHLAQEVADRIDEKKLTWKEFGGTHPGPAGNRIAADMIDGLLAVNTLQPVDKNLRKPHAMPAQPLDSQSYDQGRFLTTEEVKPGDGWTHQLPNWKALPGGKRGTFAKNVLFCSTTPGSLLQIDFHGRALGAYVLAGPDAGILEASVDGGPFQQVDLYHRYSRGLHYPRTVMLATDLKSGKHHIDLRVGKGKRTAARVLHFVVNE